jgi:hypothetical protein
MGTALRVRLPRLDLVWVHALLWAMVFATWTFTHPILGVVGWLVACGVALGSRGRAPVTTIEIRDRRLGVDGLGLDVRRVVSVGVSSRPMSLRATVMLRDADGRSIGRIAHLDPTHARALALDLADAFGWQADPGLSEIPVGKGARGPAAEFVTGLHQVRISVWSRPFRGPVLAATLAATLPVCMFEPTLGAILLAITAWLGCGLVGITPIRMRLEIDAVHLVVRTGSLWLHEARVRIVDLLPPRIVGDGGREATLLVRGRDGFLAEIRGRPREELERIAAWIDHARDGARALPEPPPDLPDDLRQLRERVRQGGG